MQKNWFKSKTVWAGIILISTGLLTTLAEYLTTGNFDATRLLQMFGEGLGLIGIRTALK